MDIPQYIIRYKGKRKVSGEECVVSLFVTEREYERVIYYHGNKIQINQETP